MKRRIFLASALGLAIATAPGLVLAQGAAVPAAETFIAGLGRRGVTSLIGPGASDAERSRRFRQLLVENFDVPTIGRFVIGRYWSIASEAERVEYMSLFPDMLVATYANRFAEYQQNERVLVSGSRTTPEGDIIVTSNVARPGQSAPAKVEWFLRRDASSFKLVDVRVEGISMAITQRDEAAAIISRGGGRVASLLQNMRQRSAQIPR
jgi:phospholipid transport system substrate-binding protein